MGGSTATVTCIRHHVHFPCPRRATVRACMLGPWRRPRRARDEQKRKATRAPPKSRSGGSTLCDALIRPYLRRFCACSSSFSVLLPKHRFVREKKHGARGTSSKRPHRPSSPQRTPKNAWALISFYLLTFPTHQQTHRRHHFSRRRSSSLGHHREQCTPTALPPPLPPKPKNPSSSVKKSPPILAAREIRTAVRPSRERRHGASGPFSLSEAFQKIQDHLGSA